MLDPEDQIRLALNRWEMGQILQPTHFLAQEEALLGETCLTARLPGLPFYGVASLDWSEAQLAKGTISFTALTVVFTSGELVKIGSNATIPDAVLKDPGDTVTLYLHLCNETDDATRLDLYKGDAPEVTRVLHRLLVSTESSIEDARQPMKLAVLRKQVGKYQLSPDYVPPLLRVGTSPFLRDLLAALAELMKKAQGDLREQLRDASQPAETRAKLRRCQVAAYRLRTFLADNGRQIHLHPYFVLEALRAFYLEACVLQDVEPEPFDPGTYDHDDLAGCFNDLFQSITDRLDFRVALSPERLEFKRRDGDSRFIAGPMPDDLLRAAEVYVLVPRPADTYEKVSLRGVKLASPKRLDFVHKRALRGVDFEPVTDPSPSLFGRDVDVYRVRHPVHRDEEWTHVEAERAIAYYDAASLRGLTLALAWGTS